MAPEKKAENRKMVIIKVAEKLWGSCVCMAFVWWPMFPEKKRNAKRKINANKENEKRGKKVHKNHWLFVGVEFSFFSFLVILFLLSLFTLILYAFRLPYTRKNLSVCHRRHDSTLMLFAVHHVKSLDNDNDDGIILQFFAFPFCVIRRGKCLWNYFQPELQNQIFNTI